MFPYFQGLKVVTTSYNIQGFTMDFIRVLTNPKMTNQGENIHLWVAHIPFIQTTQLLVKKYVSRTHTREGPSYLH